jgi:NAD(P)H dehydrogenase (quinone)
MLEWARQTYDGRMDFGAVTTPTVEELLGRKPLTLRTWIARNRQAVLEAGTRAPLAASTPTTH